MDQTPRESPSAAEAWGSSAQTEANPGGHRARFTGVFLAAMIVLVLSLAGAITVGAFLWVQRSAAESTSDHVQLPIADPEPVEGSLPELEAARVLAKSAQVYATCRTYGDTIEQWTQFIERDDRGAVHKTCATQFVRGGGFRFEFTDHFSDRRPSWIGKPNRRTVVWGTHAWVRTWSSALEVPVKYESPLSVMAALAGVSNGTSSGIPRLLLPEENGMPTLLRYDEVMMDTPERVSGRICYRLVGKDGPSNRTLWIDAESFVVRRTLERAQLDAETVVETETHYTPTLDAEIPPSVFEFEPPK